MQLSKSTNIAASPEEVWDVVSDIRNLASTIQGISRIEILESASGPSIVGLKWRETRTWQGRDAAEVIWITEAQESSHYSTRAESHGSIYTAHISLEPGSIGTRFTMSFNAKPVNVGARILWVLTGWMAKKALGKTIEQDLTDIKSKVEQATSQ